MEKLRGATAESWTRQGSFEAPQKDLNDVLAGRPGSRRPSMNTDLNVRNCNPPYSPPSVSRALRRLVAISWSPS
eukprot:11159369-Lingulodinium_polyedra.AAC.1